MNALRIKIKLLSKSRGFTAIKKSREKVGQVLGGINYGKAGHPAYLTQNKARQENGQCIKCGAKKGP